MSARPVSAWLRFPWLPGEAVLLHHRAVRTLPVVRFVLLGGVVLLGSVAELSPFGVQAPRWALPVAAAVIAVLSVFGRRNGRVPEGVTWAVRKDGRVGLLTTGYPVPGDPRIGSLTWFGPEMTAVLAQRRAHPVSESAIRLLRCAGRDRDEEEFLALAQEQPAELVLADRDGAAQVLAPRIGLSGSLTRFSRARQEVLGWFSDSSPQSAAGRITLEDVRAIATTGIAPGHRLEELLGDFALPTEADERFDLGCPRCWPSRVDGHGELDPASLVSALRADLALQVELDEKRAAEDPAEQRLVERWSRRWQDRLDAIAYTRRLPQAPAPVLPAARPALSESATLAVRLVAAETDVSRVPLRPKLTTVGVPEKPGTVAVLRPARARLWRLADTVLIALTGALVAAVVFALLA
ncbi:hypothetical protein [Allokutzneria oryzae]|uniref:Type VII secretion protein EccE n=1 Tax=Allokutzneria oryzae TaxID=1378989 RepID=A0ABV5ZQE0_9PSEU